MYIFILFLVFFFFFFGFVWLRVSLCFWVCGERKCIYLVIGEEYYKNNKIKYKNRTGWEKVDKQENTQWKHQQQQQQPPLELQFLFATTWFWWQHCCILFYDTIYNEEATQKDTVGYIFVCFMIMCWCKFMWIFCGGISCETREGQARN